MELLLGQQAKLMEEQLRRRLIEINDQIKRLQKERDTVEARLAVQAKQKAPAAKPAQAEVTCPKCGRDHDFLTDAGGYLAHVLEDPSDTDLLDSGKPLFCPACGEVFLFKKATTVKGRR